jgi:hypothetical protein
MTERINGPLPAPDVKWHQPDPEYARSLFAKLKDAGISQREAARRLSITDRILRAYASGEQMMPYTVQYALEGMVQGSTETDAAVHEPQAEYVIEKPTTTQWFRASARPIAKSDVGKWVLARDRFGATVCGELVRDSFGLVIKELHPEPVDVHSVTVDRIVIYTLVDPPPHTDTGER